ncbi:MAG TPA: glycosyltransferase [Candidatus Binataceae bacterium]|nr:glycosyltransferase [Candidatus Binataceae bacterium]
MDRLVARGKFLFEGERKFHARGVSYGPFAPNSRGERYPEPERAAQDFALIRELGANVVRTYVPPPPWMFELAAKHELRLMVGMPWPFHMAFLDSRQMTADIRATIRSSVDEMRRFADVIFAFSLGNEVRSDIVRWHGARAVSRFMGELYELGKSLAPDSLFTYSNYPSAEYLDLSFLDFICFNVYLHREPDFRRYLTHLMAATAERPLVLSETGMDTIREGEEHQAELLGWQARAAFELGLSGFIVFAFTDEWHTGGAEISDWAFGLVTRERTRKRAFEVVGEVFKGPLPPPLKEPPKVSVVVPAYNAEATLAECLDSLAHLNYPDYETIVFDDGSSDSTGEVAARAGVRVLRAEHRGLAVARNGAIAAAAGSCVAFIDADARADRDWLYHLVEALARRGAAAAGGPNFAPPAASALAAAIAAAPGQPREVRAGDDTLEQVCGCNMIVDKAAAQAAGGFDPMFTAAGDDVDFSWRLAARKLTLASAPAAVVIHDRRPTLAAYVEQQRGYGRGEGLLFRKYPLKTGGAGAMYGGGASWLGGLFGGARIYYGAFGRGLFQSVYQGAETSPLLQLPLTMPWVAIAIVMIVAGMANAPMAWLGWAAIALTLASAIRIAAVRAPAGGPRMTLAARALLALATLAGGLARSAARERVKWTSAPPPGPADDEAATVRARGRVLVTMAERLGPDGIGPLLEAMRAALVGCGLAAAAGDRYQAYDLVIVIPPGMRVHLNGLELEDGRVALSWRAVPAGRRIAAAAAAIVVAMLATGFSAVGAMAAAAIAGVCAAALAVLHLSRLPATLKAAAADAMAALGTRAQVEEEAA